jgi:hypothetical protein
MFKGSLPATALATTPALAAGSVSVYPNPATTAFTVQVPALAGVAQLKARLYNGLGAQLDFGTAGLAPGWHLHPAGAGRRSQRSQAGEHPVAACRPKKPPLGPAERGLFYVLAVGPPRGPWCAGVGLALPE